MRYDEYKFIKADINTLENMLEKMPEDRVVERIGFESRLKKMQAKLEGFTPSEPPMLCYAQVPFQPGQEEPGIMPETISAIIGAASLAAGGSIRVREIHNNLITLESLTKEAHQRMETAVQNLSAAEAGAVDTGDSDAAAKAAAAKAAAAPASAAKAAASNPLREMMEQTEVRWGHDRLKREWSKATG